MFWYDNWSGHDILSVKFPQLFELDKRKTCFVAERLCHGQPNWAWKRDNLERLEVEELNNLIGLLFLVVLSNGPDTWNSKLSCDGMFHLYDVNHFINSKVTRFGELASDVSSPLSP